MPRPLRVLILEDNPSDAELTLHELRRAGFEPAWERVDTEPDFLGRLDPPPEVILADYHMPRFDAPRALQLLRERGLDIPFIVVSGTIGEEVAVETMREGAADYLLKDRLARLGPTVERALEQRQLRAAERQAREALRSAEQRFRALIENAIDVIVTLDVNGLFAYGSPALERVLGYQPKELAGRSAFELLHPADAPAVRQAFQSVLQTRGEFVTAQARLRHKNGTWRTLELVGKNLLDDPAVRGIVVNGRDITERKQAEEQLRKLSVAVQQSPVSVVITDPQGAIEYVNPEFIRLTGYAAEEVLGKNPRLLKSGKTPPETYPQLWATITAGGVWHGEFCDKKKNGEFYWEQAVISPVRGETGEITHFLAVKEDITERKQAALQLEAFSHLGYRLSSAKTVQDAARVITSTADRLLGWDSCTFDLYSPEGDRIDSVLNIDILDGRRTDVPPNYTGARPTPRMRRAIDSGGYLTLRQPSDEPPAEGIPFGDLTRRSASILLVPIRDGSRTLAVLSIQSYTPDAYADEDLKLLQSLADFCAGALSRIRIQEALHESEALYHTTFDEAPVGVARAGLDGRFLHVNQQFARMFGYTTDELRGRHFHDIILPDDQAADLEVGQHLLKGEVAVHSREKRYVRKDGQIVWGNRTIIICRDAAAKQQYFLVAIEDITERKKAEATVHEQARLLDLANDAIFVRDLEDQVQYWNHGAERIYGWTAAEAVGRKVAELLRLDVAAFHAPNEYLLKHGEWAGELRKSSKNGKELTVYSRWTLVRADQGHPKSVLVIDTDVTEKKALEAQFLRAQRLESIGTLASGIAHDLNNILAPIQMATQLLRDEPFSTERERILNTIATSAERGAGIVKQVLTFARGVEGERVLVQLRHLVRDLVKIIQETFPKDITLRTNAPKELWPVTGDATQLHQVLLNLCVNARDAMPDGGMLAISLENLSVDDSFASMNPEASVGPYVVIEVKDTGTGIPAAVLERIFDPFFTTKPVSKGTGLGLSTALGIVKSHGGFFTVSSQVNRGTTFKVFLPATPNAPAPPAERVSPAIQPGHGELILIVDDESAIREVTGRMLHQNGYSTLSAGDGTEALALYSQNTGEIKAVVTDILMPEMDGPALVRVLKRMAPNLPIIASTGMGQSDKAEELRSLGVKLFLLKPYTADKLLRALQLALSEEPA